jgi:dTDP-4-dehydrorhamnose reductase
MKVLVVGANGQVGSELMRAAWGRDTAVTGLARPAIDLEHTASIDAAFAKATAPYDVVINAAAYTAVDKAESEVDRALAINRDGAGALAAAAARMGAALITLSTDYVFDGTSPWPYVEDDPIAPLSVYGRSKAEGEVAQRLANPRHIILRTSWVYGVNGANFVKTMLRLGAERDDLRIVADQHGAPTAAADIASAIAAMTGKISSGEVDRNALWGTYHLTGAGATTWAGFAEAIAQHQGRVTGRRPRVTPITTAEYPTPARRPANSRLNTMRIAQALDIHCPPWEVSLDRVLHTLLPPA